MNEHFPEQISVFISEHCGQLSQIVVLPATFPGTDNSKNGFSCDFDTVVSENGFTCAVL
jgi:hypothetical protein